MPIEPSNRRRSTDAQILEITERMTSLEDKHGELSRKLDTNTELTQQVVTNTAGVVEAFNAVVGGIKVLGFLARMAKIASYLIAGAGAVWALIKFGELPSPKDISPK